MREVEPERLSANLVSPEPVPAHKVLQGSNGVIDSVPVGSARGRVNKIPNSDDPGADGGEQLCKNYHRLSYLLPPGSCSSCGGQHEKEAKTQQLSPSTQVASELESLVDDLADSPLHPGWEMPMEKCARDVEG